MLTMPIDRITILLEQASEVGTVPEDEAADDESAVGAESAGDGSDEALLDTPAYRELTVTLGELAPHEVYELLAVAVIGENDNALDSWDLAVQRAQSLAAEDALAELARMLVLTDAIRNGLNRLGYGFAEGRAEEGLEGEEDEEDGEAEAEAQPVVDPSPRK